MVSIPDRPFGAIGGGDPSRGWNLYVSGIKDGSTDPEINSLIAYGVYLMNGGKKEDFECLTESDTALIRVTWEAYQQGMTGRIAEILAKAFGSE